MPLSVHHLRIALKHVRPVVRRELLVPSDLRLDRLHQVIQIVMGWDDAHLHEFVAGSSRRDEVRFAARMPGFDEDFGGPPSRDEKKSTLLNLAPAKGSKFRYSYDFGDGWDHEVTVLSIRTSEADVVVPLCVKASGACPPEDCGGPWGYANLLEVLGNPDHEDYEERREWIGEFDPAHYDLDAANQELIRLAAKWQRTPRGRKTAAP